MGPEQAMGLAIKKAWMGAGRVKTNPMVGCAIVAKDGRLISLGYHKVFGGDHAEVDALKQIKDPKLLKGATVFVTLEPCSHHGQTPPCAHKLAQLPLQSVIYGCKDPNKIASGGSEILQSKSIEAIEYSQKYSKKNSENQRHKSVAKRLLELNEVFLHNIRHQSAFIALKVATSLDGSLALKNGASQWITNKLAREKAHELRGQYNATLIGVQTYLHDNPHLNIRSSFYKGCKNKVIILDPQGRSLPTLGESNLIQCHDPDDIYIIVTEETKNHFIGIRKTLKHTKSLQKIHIYATKQNSRQEIQHKIRTEMAPGYIDLKKLGEDLYRKFHISSVLVEGGAATHSHFINQKRGQKIYQFIAPSILGGLHGRNWAQNVRVTSMENRIEVNISHIESMDSNILLTGYFPRSK